MSLTHSDRILSEFNINTFNSLSEYQEARNSSLLGNDEICLISEEFQPDYAQTDPTAPDFIKNKPFPIPTSYDSGKFLMVTSAGEYTLTTIINTEDTTY